MKLVSDYMRDDTLRHALNELTRKIFYFDFENWVVNGYFEGDYIPYSFLEDGRIISNVSVNRMTFMQNGRKKEYIQLGTVMTDEAYRKKGLAKELMEHIIGTCRNQCDGIYLFANLNATGFYRKCGFTEGIQYRYCLKPEYIGLKRDTAAAFYKTDPGDRVMKHRYMDMVRHGSVNAALEQTNKFGLQMFYTADMENVYYAEDIDCFAVMEQEENTLFLKSVISKERIVLRKILRRIDMPYERLILGFAPCREDEILFDAEPYDGGGDYRLFYLGEELQSIGTECLFFPELSHA